MSLIKKSYDKEYYENLLYRESVNSIRNKNRLKEILTYKKSGKLFEIGCAKGEFLKLAKDFFDVEGCDVSEYAINCAKKMFGDKAKLINIENESLNLNSYDVVATFNVLEHLKNPSIHIDKIYGSLKQNGILIGSVPNNQSIIGSLFTKLTNILDKTHCSTYSPQIWNDLFQKAGFKRIIFFGEVLFSKNHNVFIKNRLWPHTSLNLMFSCMK